MYTIVASHTDTRALRRPASTMGATFGEAASDTRACARKSEDRSVHKSMCIYIYICLVVYMYLSLSLSIYLHIHIHIYVTIVYQY